MEDYFKVVMFSGMNYSKLADINYSGGLMRKASTCPSSRSAHLSTATWYVRTLSSMCFPISDGEGTIARIIMRIMVTWAPGLAWRLKLKQAFLILHGQWVNAMILP